MKKKNVKDNKGKKIPQMPNAFVPQNLLNLVREHKLISCPENLKEKIFEYNPEAIPFEIPKEWVEKTEEEINNELLPEELIKKEKEKENLKTIERVMEKKVSKLERKKDKVNKKEKNIEKDKEKIETIETKEEKSEKEKEFQKEEDEEIKYPLYEDNMHEELVNNLPLSFIKLTKNSFTWLRPDEYVINEILDKEIKRLYPKKNYILMREDIKQTYETEKELNKIKEAEKNKDFSEEDDDVNALMNDDSETLKKTIYKDFYKFLDDKKKNKNSK